MESAITGPGDWRANAACRDADPDLFFPIGTTGPALRQVQEAIRICQTCPIQVRCLTWALEQGVTDGVWGGTTARAVVRRADGRGSGNGVRGDLGGVGAAAQSCGGA